MSEFGSATTADEVIASLGINLSGKNILVTGASSGIGAEASRCFAAAGGNVWLAGRDLPKTQAVAEGIITSIGRSDNVHVIHLDLSSLASVRDCVAEFKSFGVPLHILLNNAGCMAMESKCLSVDGFEMQFGTNHLGHFLLTQGLLPLLLSSSDSPRVVNVSSQAHFRSPVLFDDINFTDSAAYEGVSGLSLLSSCQMCFSEHFENCVSLRHSSLSSDCC